MPSHEPRLAATRPWITVDTCPLCGAADATEHGPIPGAGYHFGTQYIPFPETGISVRRCRGCRLFFKSRLPSPDFLGEILDQAREQDNLWITGYALSEERDLIHRTAGRDEFDLLDVGAGDGALLKACGEWPGRRSALDVVSHEGLDGTLRGEYIHALLDSPSLSWSGEPYDVVTAFDVLEHLYAPPVAFRNLSRLVRVGGRVVIETGDAGSFWPRRFGVENWWYAGLFEHHVLWTEDTLVDAARQFGFQVVSAERKRHKSLSSPSLAARAYALLKIGLYVSSKPAYAALARLAAKTGTQPRSPFAADHIRAVLRREA
jgi:SAM-dependent methyltransferase